MADIDKKEIWEIYNERPGLFQISLTASQNPPAQQIKHRMIASGKLIRCFPEGFTQGSLFLQRTILPGCQNV